MVSFGGVFADVLHWRAEVPHRGVGLLEVARGAVKRD